MTDQPFTHRFRVRYSEVDPQSVVFNSRYLEYADLILTEYWRAIDLHFSGDEALEFHVVKAVVEYKQPIRADEEIDGTAETLRIGTSSVTTQIDLYGQNNKKGGDDDLRAQIELVHVHVDLDNGKPMPIPDHARARLLAK
ncbi:acyl-CoA thioesterase [Parasphingopyxis algicola]|uniref:acyl-CoA thioesterase n=1 Tax=Parasphingopyxis algicola TaxID=2026624 RepID=UPI0015A403DC|nr:thioesterase family protein [Parasphingopyxis algicola]QLC25025.1 acyl-CoA thioesterase [Parasphingopyxis algicola]